MARKKVKLMWIANDATRRTTMKKRRKGLLKKVHELSVLCGVDACLIVYGTPSDRFPADILPSEPRGFRGLPEGERRRKMVSQESFLRQRVGKMRDAQRRQLRENRQGELLALVAEGLSGRRSSFSNLAQVEEVASLTWMLDAKFKSVYDQLETQLRQLYSATPEGGVPLQAAAEEAAVRVVDHDPQSAAAAAAAAVEQSAAAGRYTYAAASNDAVPGPLRC
ncbi:Agamous-like MADS-box protein AGL80 [Ananas comosus]|uniref:Agamous-like MADS-box protein AGL80 n=1 Tax=Ananas comosus TaxID=4615 RepID=A0A199UHJ4_ANACO|nr:Agamous-like MADS-box protein AGL80 [Ananas comosus]